MRRWTACGDHAQAASMIGILGGTFDPIHFGHLRTGMDMVQALALRELRLLPCGTPPHRAPPVASGAQRLAMVRLAVADEPGWVVDTRELERPGPSYMVDTLRSLRAEVGATPLALIVGTDAFLGLPTWHRWLQLGELAHIVVAHRPGWVPEPRAALAEWLEPRVVADTAALHAAAAGRVWFQEVTQLDIAASRIRALVAAERSARYLLPDAVVDYLRAENLYRT